MACWPRSATGAGGWALLVEAGRPVFTLSLHGSPTRLVGEQALLPGEHVVGHQLRAVRRLAARSCSTSTAPKSAAQPSRRICPLRWQVGGAGLSIGRDVGFPVDDTYEPPFPFTGTLKEVRLEVAALAPVDPAGEIALALQHE